MTQALCTCGHRVNHKAMPENCGVCGLLLPHVPKGFAALQFKDPTRQKEIASMGGRYAHQTGHAHEFTSAEAQAAGKKRAALKRAKEAGNGGAAS